MSWEPHPLEKEGSMLELGPVTLYVSIDGYVAEEEVADGVWVFSIHPDRFDDCARRALGHRKQRRYQTQTQAQEAGGLRTLLGEVASRIEQTKGGAS